MPTYRLKKGQGPHVCLDKHEINQSNPIYTTDEPLASRYPSRFEIVTGHGDVEDHPFGALVTDDFPLAETIPQCLVWKKGRRYRIQKDGNVISTDPTRLVNEDDVNKALKKLLKSIEFEEDNDSEMDEDEDETPAEDPTDDDDDSDEEEVVPVKKKKRRR